MFISAIKNFFITLILISTLFAGQDLESAKIRLKDKEWGAAEEFLLKALNHPKDKWEAAFHLADKIYPRAQEWGKVKEYMDIASTALPSTKIRPTANDKKILISQAITASLAKSYTLMFNKAYGYLGLLNKTLDNPERRALILDQAIKLSSDIATLHHTQPGGHTLLALYASIAGDKETTQKSINNALNLDDISEEDRITILLTAADNILRVKDAEKAKEYYEAVLAIDSENDTALSGIGVLYSQAGNHRKAISVFEKALEKTEDEEEKARMYYNLGVAYLKIDELYKATENFEEAFLLNDKDEQAAYGIARALEENKLWRKARKYYKKALELNPTNQSYRSGIARTIIGEDQEDAEG